MKPPTVDELVAAMHGDYDPQHPNADILRSAWLLSRFKDWITPHAIVAIRTNSTGLMTGMEDGAQTLEALGLDAALVVREALIDRIAAISGSQDYALAIDCLAVAVDNLRAATTLNGTVRDARAAADLIEARTEYEQIAEKVSSREASRP